MLFTVGTTPLADLAAAANPNLTATLLTRKLAQPVDHCKQVPVTFLDIRFEVSDLPVGTSRRPLR
jgi:hypothetical protein